MKTGGLGAFAAALVGLGVGMNMSPYVKVDVAPSAETKLCAMMAKFDAKDAQRELSLVQSMLAGEREALRRAGQWEGFLTAEIAANSPREWLVNDLTQFASSEIRHAAKWSGWVEKHLGRAAEPIDRGGKDCTKAGAGAVRADGQ